MISSSSSSSSSSSIDKGRPLLANGEAGFAKGDVGFAPGVAGDPNGRPPLGAADAGRSAAPEEREHPGEADVDGTACNIVVAQSGESSYKIYLGKSSNLPVMLAYSGFRELQAVTFHAMAPQNGDEPKGNIVFTRKVEGLAPLMTESQVKFSDYRSVGGVQLPYRWTKTGGDVDETFDITTYKINPANISEKFNNKDVKVRMMKKPDGQ